MDNLHTDPGYCDICNFQPLDNIMFSKETYIQRRNKLRKSVGSGLILLLGNDESPMNYADNGFHFRQDSSFLYFFGLNHPFLVGILDCDSGEDAIFGNDLTVEDFVWMGPQPTIANQSLQVGVTKTGDLASLTDLLRKAKTKNRKIHFLPPYRPENKIKLFNWLGVKPDESKAAASLDLILGVINQRNYKSAEEIFEISKACDVSVDMHTLSMRMAKPGISEAKIAAAVHEVALASGGQISFPIIATVNGQTLHNHYHGNTLKDGDLFLLDAGAETSMGYAGDLSSTVPVNGKFTSRQKDIYSICLDSHNHAIKMLKPGRPFKEVYFEASGIIFRGLKDLGLMKGNVEDALTNGAHALFFPCGLGHMMGLDVHDMEDLGEVYVGYGGEPKSTQFGLKSLRLGRKLEPGFVLTIEPGIYFIPELIDQWKAKGHNADYINYDKVDEYRNFGGLRNEEDFLITNIGCELLGKVKPKSIQDVEAEWAKGLI
jgi:Xaa-Pro aminopeptidase